MTFGIGQVFRPDLLPDFSDLPDLPEIIEPERWLILDCWRGLVILDILDERVRSRIFGLLSFLFSVVWVLLIFAFELPPIRFGDFERPSGDDFRLKPELGDALPGEDLRRGDFDGDDLRRGETLFFLATALPFDWTRCCSSTWSANGFKIGSSI